jgi:hypothetical protein
LTRTIATLVTLAVIAGSSAAFAVSEKLKVERAPIGAVRFEPKTRHFSPVCGCRTRALRLSYVFRRADTVAVTVVNAKGNTVRRLVDGERLARGRHAFEWDGRDDAGMLAPDGAYRLRIRFLQERRSILAPIAFQLDTRPPRVRATISGTTISPDGDGRGDAVEIAYRTSEKGTVELAVDGALLLERRAGAPRVRHRLRWGGRVPAGTGGRAPDRNGRVPARPGDHELVLTLRDIAGNATHVRFAVRVRYVELNAASYEARPGGSFAFSVNTDARSFQWSLLSPLGRAARRVVLSGESQGATASVRIPGGARPGFYVLRVEANGHRARATVRVVRGSP